MNVRINPSILASDLVNMETELHRIANADFVHVDVMDSHFVQNLTFGEGTVKRIQEVSPVPLDVHLMIENPEFWAGKYAELGPEMVTFHVEPAKNVREVIENIVSNGSKPGIALRPETPIEPYLEFLPDVVQVLVMTVAPGRGGQTFRPEVMPKLHQVFKLREEMGLDFQLQVDGGITLETIKEAAQNGADTFVAGTSVFGAADPWEFIELLRTQAAEHHPSNHH